MVKSPDFIFAIFKKLPLGWPILNYHTKALP